MTKAGVGVRSQGGRAAEADTGLPRSLVALMTERGLTLACAESLTAGMVSAGVADVPGASAVLRGGAVTYATECKASVLGVPGELLDARGAVDPDVAIAMADGTRRLFGADVGVATTGVAGPSEQDGRAVGTVFVAVVGSRGDLSDEKNRRWESGECEPRCTVQEFHFSGSRDKVRRQAAEAAWRLVIEVCSPIRRAGGADLG